jgi:LmbE family N-acetylglucosaminyl deacetylase
MKELPVDFCFALIIAPHPDDGEMGISGSVYKWTSDGKKVVYVICTNGDKGSENPDVTPAALADQREKEQIEAAAVLGVKDVVFLRYPDQTLEDTPQFRKELVRLIRMHKPEVVASCDPIQLSHWHRDHRITGQVVLDAVYPFARNRPAYPDLIEQGLEPHKVREILLWGSEQPNYSIDITDYYDTKIEAIRCHQSQFSGISPEMKQRLRSRHEVKSTDGKPRLKEFFRRILFER